MRECVLCAPQVGKNSFHAGHRLFSIFVWSQWDVWWAHTMTMMETTAAAVATILRRITAAVFPCAKICTNRRPIRCWWRIRSFVRWFGTATQSTRQPQECSANTRSRINLMMNGLASHFRWFEHIFHTAVAGVERDPQNAVQLIAEYILQKIEINWKCEYNFHNFTYMIHIDSAHSSDGRNMDLFNFALSLSVAALNTTRHWILLLFCTLNLIKFFLLLSCVWCCAFSL